MARTNLENLAVYQLAEEISDTGWAIAKIWGPLRARYSRQTTNPGSR